MALVGFCALAAFHQPFIFWEDGQFPFFSNTAIIGALILTFPIGWLVEAIAGSMHSPPLFAVIYVPINAYFWAHAVKAMLFSRPVGK